MDKIYGDENGIHIIVGNRDHPRAQDKMQPFVYLCDAELLNEVGGSLEITPEEIPVMREAFNQLREADPELWKAITGARK